MSAIEQTVPVLPWEICLRNATIFFQKQPNGGVTVKFVPLIATPEGFLPIPPGVEIAFNPEGWERFKGDVARDGETSPIMVAAPGLITKLNGNDQHDR